MLKFIFKTNEEIDPKTGNVTRVGKMKNAAGKSVRMAKKSGEEIK